MKRKVELIDHGLDSATQEWVSEIRVTVFSRTPKERTFLERMERDRAAAKGLGIDDLDHQLALK